MSQPDQIEARARELFDAWRPAAYRYWWELVGDRAGERAGWIAADTIEAERNRKLVEAKGLVHMSYREGFVDSHDGVVSVEAGWPASKSRERVGGII